MVVCRNLSMPNCLWFSVKLVYLLILVIQVSVATLPQQLRCNQLTGIHCERLCIKRMFFFEIPISGGFSGLKADQNSSKNLVSILIPFFMDFGTNLVDFGKVLAAKLDPS